MLLAVIVAIIALIWWWRRGGESSEVARAPVAAAASAAPAPAASAPAIDPAPSSSAAPAQPGTERMVPVAPDAPPPYPPGSQPLTEGVDPALSVQEDDPIDSDHPEALHAIFGARRDVVHPPDPLVVDLAIVDAAGKRVAVHGARVRFRSERATPEHGPWFTAPFVDDGSHRYVATFKPSASEKDALIGYRVFLEVGFDAPGGLGPRAYGSSMMYTEPPRGHLNGRYTEAVIDGSLVVGAGVTIEAAGRFKVIASLYGADQQHAIAFAQRSVDLPVGDGSIPLQFFGKILRDAGLDGPYVLRYVMLFEEHPDRGTYAPGVTIDPAYTTSAYRARDFSPDPYVAPPVSGPVVTAQSPSQQGKPPPMFTRGAPPASSSSSSGGADQLTAPR
ncbi:MAG TPA: hypothetical protein VL463_00195 [Kofleriaceae bacterium]|nr:hypothetical protein [Kofleriaceae bacterium]